CRVLGETLRVSRVGYGTIDPVTETLHVDRDWTSEGVGTHAGVTPLREYGSFIDSLKKNEFINIGDVREDPRTAPAAAALERRSARSFMNVPVVDQGRLVAVLFVNHAEPRAWTEAETAFIRDIALRTRLAVERARGTLELQASESRLRTINETLEQRRPEELIVKNSRELGEWLRHESHSRPFARRYGVQRANGRGSCKAGCAKNFEH
ncbi:GAF domain-containing protein, partial [Variovorax rhizosphaerae]